MNEFRKTLLLLTILAIINSIAKVESAEKVKVQNKKSITNETFVTNLSNPRSQGSTGFCYGFAATELVQQFYCKTKGSDCQDPNDVISVLDTMRGGISNVNNLTSGGSSFKVVSDLKDGATIATEECAPFAKTYLNGHPSREFIGGTIETDQARSIWMNHYWPTTSDKEILQSANQFIEIMKFETSPEEIFQYLKDPNHSANMVTDFDRFLTTFIIPESCYTQGRTASIPRFRVKRFSKDKVSLKDLAKLISSNIPVQWSLNIFTVSPSGEMQFGLYRHAVVIIGVRKTGNKTEFLIRDSGLKEGFNYWVEESVMQKVVDFDRYEAKTNPDREPFTWIEPI